MNYILGLFALLLWIASTAEAMTSVELRDYCLSVEAVATGARDNKSLSDGSICGNYIRGLVDGVVLIEAWHNLKRSLCIPEGTDMRPIAATYVQFISGRPQDWGREPSSTVFVALAKGFPCEAASIKSPSPSTRQH